MTDDEAEEGEREGISRRQRGGTIKDNVAGSRNSVSRSGV